MSAFAPAANGETATSRVMSIDVYRGLVMLLMVAELLRLWKLRDLFPGSRVAEWISFHTEHVPWGGLSLHDLIQPSFSFLVGTAMAYSLAKRIRLGETFSTLAWHAAWRALVLVLLGVFLRSLDAPATVWRFDDTLSQIGLGYFPLFLIALAPVWFQGLSIVLVLVGYWLAFVLYPAPPTDFDYLQVGATAAETYQGFLAHWNKNSNLAWAFDRWFLNLFPRAEPFLYHRGGYATLNFIPTLATMLLGLLAGHVLRGKGRYLHKLALLLVAACIGLVGGICLEWWGINPIVKRIWTPAFVLYSGGWCFLILAVLYAVIDGFELRRWALPLAVIGMNSIAIYVMSWTMRDFFYKALERHLGWTVAGLGDHAAHVLLSAGVIGCFWWILYWMYRHRIFIKL